MATLSNFGIQFASKVLEKTYQDAVFEAVVNREYEGEIKKPGDRVRILSFLNTLSLSDYVVGTDMVNEAVVDSIDALVVEKRKYYMFTLDRLEDVFTFAGDVPENLLTDAAKTLERTIDTYVLNKFGEEIKAGSWVGVNLLALGSGQTAASITTTATGGTITITTSAEQTLGGTGYTTFENPLDGNNYFYGFQSVDLYKGLRLVSTRAFVSPWYRISGITSSTVATLTEWDEATSGGDFEEGYTLRGLFGGDGKVFPKYGTGDASLLTMDSLGFEIQAAIATTITSTTVYGQTVLLNEALNDNEVPDTDRKFVVNPTGKTALLSASQLQPTGISEIYSGVVLNGRAMRLGGFDIHVAAGSRVSTRAGHSTSSGTGADTALTTGTTGNLFPAVHTGCMTYADKWAESRVVDAENQFSKKYQGLYLFGAKIPAYRRKYGAMLFGS